MAIAPVSKAGGRNPIQVRVLYSPLYQINKMEIIYLLILLIILFIIDVICVTSISLFIYNSLLFLKIKSKHKQDATSFLNTIKEKFDRSIPSTYIFAYVAYTLISLIVYLFLRFALFYVFQLKIDLFYSIPIVYFLLIPLSFFFGIKSKVENIDKIKYSIPIGQRDVTTGDIIFGLFAFFSFKTKSKFYNFLSNVLIAILKPIKVMQWVVMPSIITIGGIIYLIKTKNLETFLPIILIGLVALSMFYNWKRNLKLTIFTKIAFIIIFVGLIYVIIKNIAFFLLIFIPLVIFFYQLNKYKKKKLA